MRLLVKFSALFLLLVGFGSAVGGFLAWQFLVRTAQSEAAQQARLLLQTALAMRHYTSAEIAPLLDTPEMRSANFLPQSIPFYAATQGLNALRTQYPDYIYKEATLNPTNLRDRATDWEADVINKFRNSPQSKEFVGQRGSPSGLSVFLARPIRVQKQCLECHSSPEAAPVSMTRIYGTEDGFGWRANEIVGAQIVSLPLSQPLSLAQRAFRDLMVYVGVAVFAILLLLDAWLYIRVVRPVTKMSKAAREAGSGRLDRLAPAIGGSDEIASLGRSVGAMLESLSKALSMLEANLGNIGRQKY